MAFAIKLNFVKLTVILLNVVWQNVILLNVVAPSNVMAANSPKMTKKIIRYDSVMKKK